MSLEYLNQFMAEFGGRVSEMEAWNVGEHCNLLFRNDNLR